jgi:quinol monooxygenase YgiN
MSSFVLVLTLGVAMILLGSIRDAVAQTAAPPAIEGPIHAVTYVEVMPTARTEAAATLTRYREAARKDDGNLRCEVVSRIGQTHHFVVLEVWKDRKAFEAQRGSAHTGLLREKIQAICTAPIDERVHVGVSVGPLQPGPAGSAVYVVMHVDVIPPRKDDGLAALERLASDSRGAPGNVRFEVVQQTNRPNHFTVVEIWKDASAVEAHAMADRMRQFRDTLGPMSGALYDERLYSSDMGGSGRPPSPPRGAPRRSRGAPRVTRR